MTYRDAGVDVHGVDRLVEEVAAKVTATWSETVVGPFGAFAAGFRVPSHYRRPVVMMSTDGVGTKLAVALQAGRLEGIGQDLVAMCVDDVAATGAEPAALTDYVAVGSLDAIDVAALIESVAAGCATAGVALLGGETAEHPGVVDAGHVDLAGTAVGFVEADDVVDGSAIRIGDALVAVGSTNLRSNGFSLIRARVLDHIELSAPMPGVGQSVGDVLLASSTIYAPAVVAACRRSRVHGLAHVTGGGLGGNLGRVLPPGLGATVDTATWERPAVFRWVAEEGGIDGDEMFRVFNMGVGYLAVVPPSAVDDVVSIFAESGHRGWVAGRIDAAPGVRLL